jgi:hypothetical protein
MIRRPITQYLDGRLHEWLMAGGMVMLGLSMMLWPKIANGSIMQILVQTIGGFAVALVFFFVGVSSLAALVANGNSLEIGPRIRAFSAVIRAILWASFTLSMTRVSIEQGFPSPMVFFWGPFTVAEIYISYRATLDVRNGR